MSMSEGKKNRDVNCSVFIVVISSIYQVKRANIIFGGFFFLEYLVS